MDGGWSDVGGGTMMARLLFDGGDYQVGHDVSTLATASNETRGRGSDMKNSQPG